jgi:enoyl-CoA hydratase
MKTPLAITSAIKSINANYKDGENGFETEIKSFGKCFAPKTSRKELLHFGEKKSRFTGE